MWLNIYDADPLKSDCADKLKVKDYARNVLGEMTFTPGAFMFKYKKSEDKIKIGNKLQL